MLDLPRAVRLAAWASALLDGETDLDTALRAVQRDDEPHTLSGDAAPFPTLADLLRGLAASGATGIRVALPAPGDPGGLAGPPGFTAEATDAGEAVLVEARAPLGLVPEVTEFGSVLEPGALTDWHVHLAVLPPPLPDGLGDADRSLREALRTATDMLSGLEVSRWREDAAERIASVRDGGLPQNALPPGTDPRAARVIGSAARVRAITALALEDDGGAVTGWEATRRAAALRDVDRVARRALAAAVNAQVSEPRTRR